MCAGTLEPTKPTHFAGKTVSIDTTRTGNSCAPMAHGTCARACHVAHAHLSVPYHTCAMVFMRHGMRQGSRPRFPRTADFGDSRKARLRAPAVAVETLWHACIIFHVITGVHAAFHATYAHIERERDHPRPEPNLAAARSAAQVHAACVLVHALFSACHATL